MNVQTRARFFLIAIVMFATQACAHNRSYTSWDEPTEMSRRPVGEPVLGEDGKCTRVYEITYEKSGARRFQTINQRSSLIAVAALGATAVGSFVFAAAADSSSARGQWALLSLGSATASVVWGLHTLWVGSQRPVDTPLTSTSVEEEKLAADGCGAPAVVAELSGPPATECVVPALADRKLEQLEDLRAEGLIDDAKYDADREQIEASRCAEPEPSDSNVAERLRQLEQLRSEGLIDDAEYAAKRSEVLGQL